MAHILKFGGSSVSNAKAIKNIKNIINNVAQKRDTAVVVSALYGVTNKLIETMEFAKKGDVKEMRNHLDLLCTMHKSVASSSGNNIDYIFSRANQNLEEILDTQKITKKNSDRIVSIGEKLSASIISSSQSNYKYTGNVIVTNNNYGNAYPIMNATKAKSILITKTFSENKIPIIPGFFGHTMNGNITTLGRGGSDLTATVIANCIGAKDISFYKVECNSQGDWEKGLVGIIHPNRETIQHLSFSEMHEMGILGRTVLHGSTMKPIIHDKNLTVHIKNTLEPAKAGTKITLNGAPEGPGCATMMIDKSPSADHVIVHLIGQNHKSLQIDEKYKILYKTNNSISLFVKEEQVGEIFNLYVS